MASKFDSSVISDNLTQGMGSIAAATMLYCSPTTHLCGLSLSIGKGGGSISGHQWWVLGDIHKTTVNAQKIFGDIDANNSAKITINLNPSSHTFSTNSRVTKWRNGQLAINTGDTFLVQDGTEDMRNEVKSREWSFRLAVECVFIFY